MQYPKGATCKICRRVAHSALRGAVHNSLRGTADPAVSSEGLHAAHTFPLEVLPESLLEKTCSPNRSAVLRPHMII